MNTFNFAGADLRTITLDGTLWFVAIDALRILGLETSGTAYRKLDADEKTKLHRMQVGEKVRGKPMVGITESGLNKLLMRSDKPEAKQFQDWLAREVLPSIRKTGSYTKPADREVPLFDELAAFMASVEERLRNMEDPLWTDNEGRTSRISELDTPHLLNIMKMSGKIPPSILNAAFETLRQRRVASFEAAAKKKKELAAKRKALLAQLEQTKAEEKALAKPKRQRRS